MAANPTVVQGPGFLTLLALLFITLRLCGVIGWSWWWVTAPLWAPVALVLAILAVVFLVLRLVALFSK